MLDITTITTIDFALIVKILILLFIGMYAIFVFIIANNVRSLNRVVQINKALGSPLVQILSTIYFLATIALFIATLVIL